MFHVLIGKFYIFFGEVTFHNPCLFKFPQPEVPLPHLQSSLWSKTTYSNMPSFTSLFKIPPPSGSNHIFLFFTQFMILFSYLQTGINAFWQQRLCYLCSSLPSLEHCLPHCRLSINICGGSGMTPDNNRRENKVFLLPLEFLSTKYTGLFHLGKINAILLIPNINPFWIYIRDKEFKQIG